MRKISTISYLLLSSFSLFLISSCQKEPSSDTLPEINCLLEKAYYYDDTGTVADSMAYTYTNNKVIKVSNADGYITLEYTNEKVSKRNFYSTGFPDSHAYDVVTYNADGTLATIKTYFDFNGQVIQFEQYEFSYTNGKLVKLDIKEYDPDTSQFELYETTTYTYTGDNITQSITNDRDAGTPDEIFHYSHDNNENYFIKSNALFTDFAFVDGLQGSSIPLLISANNVTRVFDDTDELLLNYKLDSKNNFYEWYFDDVLASRYFYDCK